MENSYFTLFFSAIFVSNIVLAQFLGICSFLGVSKSVKNALGMGSAVSFVMLLATIMSWTIYHLFLVPLNLVYLKTIVFILTIATLVQLVEMFMKKHLPILHKNMGVFLPLITTNCAILGIALINTQKEYSFMASIVNSVGTALGYTFAIVLFSTLRERLEEADLPSCMKDLPIALITASCMSIALMGLSGIH